MEYTNCQLMKTVTRADFASTMKSGSLPVLATPAVAAWMEEAACQCLHLEEGMTSVGIHLELDHLAPSPEGASIRIEARVTETRKKLIFFEIEAYMADVLIAKASHTRALVNAEAFIAKCYQKD